MSDQLTITERLTERGERPEGGLEYTATVDRPFGCVGRPCDWLPRVERQLRAIAALAPGWDSHGAPSPDGRVVDAAERLIGCVSEAGALPEPYVNPTPGGGVQFEWESGPRYFEVEVLAERAAQYFYRDDALRIEEQGEVFEGESLGDVVAYVSRVASAS